jgi:hypothetical protein
MGALDKIKTIAGGFDETWKDRTRSGILFTSPDGQEFEAAWIENDKSKEKKLQISYYTDVKGNRVKDREINSPTEPITFYFSGANNDLETERFWKACDENGQWEIVHPVTGFESMQLVSVRKHFNPVRGGGVTEITTEWIEPLNQEAAESGRSLGSMADALGIELNNAMGNSFFDKLARGVAALKAGIARVTGAVAGISNKVLGPIAAINDAAWESFMAVQGGIRDIRNMTVLEALSIAGQLQALIQIPLRATTDHRSRMSAYSELATANLSLLAPGDSSDGTGTGGVSTDTNGRNKALIVEVASMATIVAVSEIATTSKFVSRADALEFATDMVALVDEITEGLEVVQEKFKDEFPDAEYVASADTGEILRELVSVTVRYIRKVAADIGAEKRIVLDRPRQPLEIVLTEYGSDDRFDEFLETNSLILNDTLFLEAGREVILNV